MGKGLGGFSEVLAISQSGGRDAIGVPTYRPLREIRQFLCLREWGRGSEDFRRFSPSAKVEAETR